MGRMRPCDSVIVAENNNYLTSAIMSCDSDSQLNRWSSSSNWTRKSPYDYGQVVHVPSHHRRKLCWIGVISAIAFTLLLVIGILFVANPFSEGSVRTIPDSRKNLTTTNRDRVTLSPTQIKNKKASISKHAWFALQKNEARQAEPSGNLPVFSITKDKVHRVPCGGSPRRTPCCSLEKSTEVLEYEGCTPIEVPKTQCRGGCDMVFVDGNPFVSIPKCQPVRKRKLKFKVHCGEELRRISIEVVARCRCA